METRAEIKKKHFRMGNRWRGGSGMKFFKII